MGWSCAAMGANTPGPLRLRRPPAPSPFTQITSKNHGKAICPPPKAFLEIVLGKETRFNGGKGHGGSLPRPPASRESYF